MSGFVTFITSEAFRLEQMGIDDPVSRLHKAVEFDGDYAEK
jgi:hypothetical protein